MRRLLIVGNSHAACIRAAARHEQNVMVQSVKGDSYDLKEMVEFEPDIVGLCFRGNIHNIFALFEHTVPFTSAGLPLYGVERVSIPKAQVRDHLFSIIRAVKSDARKIHEKFPEARFCYVCAPPPLQVTNDTVKVTKAFEGVAKNGVAPTPLRLLFYNIQTEIYREFAEESGAEFIYPPSEALTDEGLLASEYCANDPTHANHRYGQLMLNKILKWGENG